MKNLKLKRFLTLLLAMTLILSLAVGCSSDEEPVEEPEEDVVVDETDEETDAPENEEIILSTTTSTQDSGLLDYLIPEFEEDTGYVVKTVAVGTGKALQMGEDGEADVLLVHAKESELEFVEEGHGTERHDVMYNDFVLVGPAEDPANVSEDSADDISASLEALEAGEFEFVSRGDDSGTHKKELAIWEAAGIEPAGEWYVEAGQGMADVLKIADENEAYTITDRATYLSMQDDLDLEILVEGDENLFNQYGIIPVNPEKGDMINNEGAIAFMEWMLSEKAQEMIAEFGVEDYGQALFVPNAE